MPPNESTGKESERQDKALFHLLQSQESAAESFRKSLVAAKGSAERVLGASAPRRQRHFLVLCSGVSSERRKLRLSETRVRRSDETPLQGPKCNCIFVFIN